MELQAQSDILTEFLECSFHMILYTRSIYPPAIFKPKRLYNTSIQMSCHAEVNQYIKNILATIYSLLLQNAVYKIIFSITNTQDNSTVEKFVFTLHQMFKFTHDDRYLLEVEENLRAVLLKIAISDSLLKPLPPNCTFSVFVHTNTRAAASLEHQQKCEGFPWIQCNNDVNQQEVYIIPLKSVANKLMKLDIHIETKDVLPQ